MDMGQCLFEMGAPGGVKRVMVETCTMVEPREFSGELGC